MRSVEVGLDDPHVIVDQVGAGQIVGVSRVVGTAMTGVAPARARRMRARTASGISAGRLWSAAGRHSTVTLPSRFISVIAFSS